MVMVYLLTETLIDCFQKIIFFPSESSLSPWWLWVLLYWRNQPQTSSRSAGCLVGCTADCLETAGRYWILSGSLRSAHPSAAASRADLDYFSSETGGGISHTLQGSYLALVEARITLKYLNIDLNFLFQHNVKTKRLASIFQLHWQCQMTVLCLSAIQSGVEVPLAVTFKEN